MPIRFSLSEKFGWGVLLLATLPYFLTVILSVYIYQSVLTCVQQYLMVPLLCVQRLTPLYFLLLGFWFFVVVGEGLLIFYFIKKITRPIEELTEMVGEIATGKIRAIPYRKEKNEIAQLFNSVRIMSDTLISQVRQLQESNRAKSDFVSIASHQLRTPLSAIKWLIELLKENSKLPPEEQSKLNDIYKSNERLIRLVEDLLNVSRIESGKIPIERKPVNILDLINGTINLCKDFAENKGQKIKLTIEAESKTINTDVLLFNEALSNLLENASYYSPENTEIEVTLTENVGQYIIAIHNEGPAIPESEHDKLFTKFYRGAAAQRLRPTGSGLGLFVSKTAIETLGGKVWFESPTHENGGVTFYISIPIS